MGSSESSVKHNPISYEIEASKLGYDFKKKIFVKARTSSTITQRKREIKRLGACLNGKDFNFLSQNDLDRVCFIMVNTYKRPDFHLGVGPMNDASIVASNHHRRGYKIFFLHNSTRDEFLTYFKFFIQNTTTALTVFYAGRTTKLQLNKPYEGQKNQIVRAMVFEQGYVIDYDIATILVNFKKNKEKVVLLSDCLHGGPIWNFDMQYCSFQSLPENIISISVTNNEYINDYDKILMTNDGIFTVCLWKVSIDYPNVTPEEIIQKLSLQMKKFGLSIVYKATSEDLYSKPLFL